MFASRVSGVIVTECAGKARSGVRLQCLSMCCVRVPPCCTFRICKPRQMANRGRSRSSAWAINLSSKGIPLIVRRFGLCNPRFPVPFRVDVFATRQEDA